MRQKRVVVPMAKYETRIAIFSSGERFPVVLDAATYQPISLPIRFVVDRRRDFRQSGTIERDVRVLKWLYEWADDLNIDLERQLRMGNALTVNHIVSFCRHLRL